MNSFDMLLAGAWKSAVVLGAAFASAWILRRTSAALRHFLWTAAFAVLLLLPFLPATRPVRIAAPAIAVSAASVPVSHNRTAALVPLASYFWLAGAVFVLGRFLTGSAHVAWLKRHARLADYYQPMLAELRPGSKVRVFECPAVPVPVACGIFRPSILLPAGARDWPLDRLAAVMRHELAHIARGDLAAQYLSQAACCLYWFQPLVWLAARCQRRERELACDDAVLATGIAADQYATHLVELTRTLGERRVRGLNATTRTGPPDLETRVRSLFAVRDRRPLRMRVALAILADILAVGLPVGSLRVYAQTARGSFSGTVLDPSGTPVADCQVTAKNQDGTNEEVASCNDTGEYHLSSIPAGKYNLIVSQRGFKQVTLPIVILPNVSGTVNVNLALGETNELVHVFATRPQGSSTQPASASEKPRGGSVTPAMLIDGPKPVYPPSMKQAGVEGSVVVRAVISKSGTVLNPKVVNTVIDPAFSQAALDAVSKWRYKPSMLNGEPVEVVTTVTVDFKLEQ